LDYFISERLSYSIPPPEVAAVAGGIFLVQPWYWQSKSKCKAQLCTLMKK
jgi:hypothetical protein